MSFKGSLFLHLPNTAKNFILEQRASLIQEEIAKQIANETGISILRVGKVQVSRSQVPGDPNNSLASIMVNLLLLEKAPSLREYTVISLSLSLVVKRHHQVLFTDFLFLTKASLFSFLSFCLLSCDLRLESCFRRHTPFSSFDLIISLAKEFFLLLFFNHSSSCSGIYLFLFWSSFRLHPLV